MFGKRGFILERATEQVCREAGARVSTNVFVQDKDLAEYNFLDNRRLEVVADGLSLWNGSQLAIDTSAGGKPPRIRSSLGKKDEHGWWCWRRKWEDVSRKKQHLSCTPWPTEVSLRFCEAASEQPSLGILACTAAKSFAVSLLDHRPACNTGMDPPSVHDGEGFPVFVRWQADSRR